MGIAVVVDLFPIAIVKHEAEARTSHTGDELIKHFLNRFGVQVPGLRIGIDSQPVYGLKSFSAIDCRILSARSAYRYQKHPARDEQETFHSDSSFKSFRMVKNFLCLTS
jgi:hypothetical protein